MKRKIAAIFAADIAGYSRLVAEDEEETLRRLASYRSVVDDFIARAGGRIFNTAGDAVLAEFPSAVDAVRCAIDIQESLRTRNMAYPPSRHMSFRIGINIGDVIERDGDLLGDGVNIAARLEGLAEVGGICISRSVHEQVANKLSVQFADIGAQEVKNIPTPVHAYMVAMRRDDGAFSIPLAKQPSAKSAITSAPTWLWPVVVGVVSVVAIVVAGLLYFTRLEMMPAATQASSATPASTPAPSSAPAPSAPAPQMARAPAAPPTPKAEIFAADTVPFVGDRARSTLASDYAPGADYKAFALTPSGVMRFVVAQPSEEAARSAALEQCQKQADNVQPQRRCELYAVGNSVVYSHGRPPMPPLPWIRHDPATERPFAAAQTPIASDQAKARIGDLYAPGRKVKSLALGPNGRFTFNAGQENADELVRRSLENCGATLGVACMIVAVDDVFVVAVPTLMKATGFFRSANNEAIAADARDDVARQLAGASSGWNAVAVGIAKRPGLALRAGSEQGAITDALANCARRDNDCRVIAIGPFAVGPNN